MKKYFKKIFKRNDNKNLLLFSLNEHKENSLKELEISNPPSPHLRWHPLRNEWISYSPGREKRTSFPPKKYCPFCPSGNLNFPTEIPFENFEVAVVPNRWSSFESQNDKNFYVKDLDTKASKGQCEVVIYSKNHNDTLADMSIDQIKLLIYAWNDRYKELLIRDDIKYVMPFENRGELCGVTLHHPHGQIYSYPFIPPVIKKELNAFKKKESIIVSNGEFRK